MYESYVAEPSWWSRISRRFRKRLLLHIASALLFRYGILSSDWKSISEIRREARRLGIKVSARRLYYILERLVLLGILERTTERRKVLYRIKRLG